MKRSGNTDLPLHYGYVPIWLAENKNSDEQKPIAICNL
jgi:hypothetical protein